MKLRYLATVVTLALTTVAARSQVGIYMNPAAVRVSNSVKDTGPFAFLGENSNSEVFYGFNLGGYYDFYHSGSLGAGVDLRIGDAHANNGVLKDFLIGVRLSGTPFQRPIKPYVQVSGGVGFTKAPQSTVRIRKPMYGVFAGADYTIAKHVDVRMLEIGYSSLGTVSSWTVGAGGNTPIPNSKLLSFSSGLVFRF